MLSQKQTSKALILHGKDTQADLFIVYDRTLGVIVLTVAQKGMK